MFKIESLALVEGAQYGGSLTITISSSNDDGFESLRTVVANLVLSKPDEVVDALMGIRRTVGEKGTAPAVETKPKAEEKPAEAPKRGPGRPPKAAPVETPKPEPEPKVETKPEPKVDPMDEADPMDEPSMDALPDEIVKSEKMRPIVNYLADVLGMTEPDQAVAWAMKHKDDVPFLKGLPNPVERVKVAFKMKLQGT